MMVRSDGILPAYTLPLAIFKVFFYKQLQTKFAKKMFPKIVSTKIFNKMFQQKFSKQNFKNFKIKNVVRQFPYDIQRCTMLFKSMTYTYPEVTLIPMHEKVWTGKIQPHIEWVLTDTAVKVSYRLCTVIAVKQIYHRKINLPPRNKKFRNNKNSAIK